MSTKTNIEWTEMTWNPTTGCTKISPGCKYCYAEVMANRLQAMGAAGYEQGFKLQLHPDRLKQPLARKKSTTYFVNSMSDLFHEEIPFAYLDQVFAIIRQTPQHTYQILTKRPEHMENYFKTRMVPVNAWLGVSVEDRKYGLPRIDILRRINASTRFLSIEPLLEDLGEFNLQGIQWVIVGGESGAKARPMQEAWIGHIANQCSKNGAAFFFKQWGAWGADGVKRSKSANGREFQGRIWAATPSDTQMDLALKY
ncbi:MAG: phage Gp37/Gp68 family protein [Alphaproteobacteria bacterium]|nr:phage Gp37/Gp68 family protein [Alphaproteobacteria bacterium]